MYLRQMRGSSAVFPNLAEGTLPEVRDFLGACLVPDPQKRALMHSLSNFPFLQTAAAAAAAAHARKTQKMGCETTSCIRKLREESIPIGSRSCQSKSSAEQNQNDVGLNAMCSQRDDKFSYDGWSSTDSGTVDVRQPESPKRRSINDDQLRVIGQGSGSDTIEMPPLRQEPIAHSTPKPKPKPRTTPFPKFEPRRLHPRVTRSGWYVN